MRTRPALLLAALLPAVTGSLHAATATAHQNYGSLGVRVHYEHSVFEDYPFGDRDVSYTVAYEYHEGIGFWQLAVGVTPDVTRTNALGAQTTQYLITPQLHLVLKERYLFLGVGAMGSYINRERTEADEKTVEWSDLYWQLQLGLQITPTARLTVRGAAYYVFEKWNELEEFDTEDIEYGVSLAYRF